MKSQSRLASFKAAFSGLLLAFKQERNFQIHCLCSIFVLCLGFAFQVNTIEWLMIIIAIAFVLIAELFNSAIEHTVDFISEDYSKQAKGIKDLAAAAVLLSALVSGLIGMILFYPKILALLGVYT